MVWPPNQMSLSARAPRLNLATSHCSCFVQTLYRHCILSGHTVAERLGAVRGGDSGGVEQIFRSPRNSVKWAAVVSGTDFFVRLFSLRESQVARQRDYAVQLGIELLESALDKCA